MCVTFHFYSFYFIFLFYLIFLIFDIFKLYFIFFQISFYFIFLYESCFISFYFIFLYQGGPPGRRPLYIQRHMQGLIFVNPKRGRTPQSSSSTRSYESKLRFRVSIEKKIRFRGLYTRGGPLL